MNEYDDLEIPEFLKRSHGEASAGEPAKVADASKSRRELNPADASEESIIRRIADKRWRQWAPGPGAGLKRPRITTFRKQVREEFARKAGEKA